MKNVMLNMWDTINNKEVTRIIDGTNAYSSGVYCWELKGLNEQIENLESWIKERGNSQHDTILTYVSHRFIKNS